MAQRTVFWIMVVAWLLVPTGTPDDVITFFIIKAIGLEAYVVVLLLLLGLMWHYKVNLKKVGLFVKKNFAWINKKVFG